jgi:hypothetical protein
MWRFGRLKFVTSLSHILLKCAKDNSGPTKTLEALMSYANKLHIFSGLTLHSMYINVAEQQLLYVRTNVTSIQVKSRGDA